MTRRSVLVGTGSALPVRAVSNLELSERVDTSDEWIVERTGIRSRHLAGEGETTASLATDAARAALTAAGVEAKDVGLIVLGLVLMLTWRAKSPDFFRGETLHKDTPVVVD